MIISDEQGLTTYVFRFDMDDDCRMLPIDLFCVHFVWVYTENIECIIRKLLKGVFSNLVMNLPL